jgi:hypothetical protein
VPGEDARTFGQAMQDAKTSVKRSRKMLLGASIESTANVPWGSLR